MTTTTLLNHTMDFVKERPPIGHDIYGIPTFVLWNILIVLAIALIFYWLTQSAHKETALDILKKRYASGEIDKERFESMKKDIGE